MPKRQRSSQQTNNQIYSSSDSSSENDSSQSLDLFSTARERSPHPVFMKKNFSNASTTSSDFQFPIIYFQSNSKRTSIHSSHQHLIHCKNVDLNEDIRPIKYSIGISSKPLYINENQLRRRHYEIQEDQERQKQDAKFKQIYGNFPKPNRPIHRYFQPGQKCKNCKKRGHRTSECKEEGRFLYSLMRSNQTRRGLIIDVRSNNSSMQYYDY